MAATEEGVAATDAAAVVADMEEEEMEVCLKYQPNIRTLVFM